MDDVAEQGIIVGDQADMDLDLGQSPVRRRTTTAPGTIEYLGPGRQDAFARRRYEVRLTPSGQGREPRLDRCVVAKRETLLGRDEDGRLAPV